MIRKSIREQVLSNLRRERRDQIIKPFAALRMCLLVDEFKMKNRKSEYPISCSLYRQ
jgi:hypothetical protein